VSNRRRRDADQIGETLQQDDAVFGRTSLRPIPVRIQLSVDHDRVEFADATDSSEATEIVSAASRRHGSHRVELHRTSRVHHSSGRFAICVTLQGRRAEHPSEHGSSSDQIRTRNNRNAVDGSATSKLAFEAI
jgi:hypothetical protein